MTLSTQALISWEVAVRQWMQDVNSGAVLRLVRNGHSLGPLSTGLLDGQTPSKRKSKTAVTDTPATGTPTTNKPSDSNFLQEGAGAKQAQEENP